MGDIFDLSKIKTISMPEAMENDWKIYNSTPGRKGIGRFSRDLINLNTTHNWMLDGFFQSWKFFSGKEKHVRSLITFRAQFVNQAQVYLDSISSTNSIKIAIHVRRGDFTTSLRIMQGFTVADAVYIKNAISYLRSKLDTNNIDFIIITNDIVWCTKNIKRERIHFSPFSFSEEITNVGYDLALMRLCDHAIITGGTFGWMGAWFSGGTVVYYKDFIRNGSLLDRYYSHEDYYPPTWIGIQGGPRT